MNNLGFIYTAVRDIIFFADKDGRTPIKDEYGLAVTVGQIYYWLLISSHFSQLIYTVNPIPINEITGVIETNPPIKITEAPKLSGVLIVSQTGAANAVNNGNAIG